MKFVAITLLALIAAVYANPISVSDNNIGDIVNVGISANLELSNKVEQNIISVILGILNQQAIVIGRRQGQATADAADTPDVPKFKITPEMIDNIKNLLTKN